MQRPCNKTVKCVLKQLFPFFFHFLLLLLPTSHSFLLVDPSSSLLLSPRCSFLPVAISSSSLLSLRRSFFLGATEITKVVGFGLRRFLLCAFSRILSRSCSWLPSWLRSRSRKQSQSRSSLSFLYAESLSEVIPYCAGFLYTIVRVSQNFE